jgi:dihydrofolate synthase/folylpolyglutamate synthase
MSSLPYRASIDFLFNLEKSVIKLGLERTENLLAALGNPEDSFRSIHVAGTNGKGSVACFLNSILHHGGLVTGLFTSPHLVDYRERVRVGGRAVSRTGTVALVRRIREPVLSSGASFFEATTGLAFEHFRREGVEAAVVEVGMGGRLDSTNVLQPLVSVITSIDYDHTTYLGKSLGKIAGEKAGIIKPGVPVVCGRLGRAARRRIGEVAARRGSRVYELGVDADCRMVRMGLAGAELEYSGLFHEGTFCIRSSGLHQVENAGLALLVAEVAGGRGLRAGETGMRLGLERAFWHGRLQVLRKRPLAVCDAAHNVSGARCLARSLRSLGFRSDVTVFGVLRDKDYRRMLNLLAPVSGRFVFTRPGSKRALPAARLMEAGRGLGPVCEGRADPSRALTRAVALAGREGNVLVCGSVFLLGEAMSFFGFTPYAHSVC